MKETKSFIIRMTIKTVILLIILAVAGTLVRSPVITNEIALAQMSNDSFGFIGFDVYNSITPYVSLVLYLIAVFVFAKIVFNIYKFVKNKKEDKENNIK